MIPGFDLIQFAQSSAPIMVLVVVAIIIFAENGLLIGFFLPGDSILFTIGVLIQGTDTFKLDLNIYFVIFILYLAATIGSSVGYAFGKKIGGGLFNKPNSRFFKQENVTKAKEFYEKHGGKTIILARFVPIVRTFVPLIAGITKMKYKTFMTYNLIGGLLWVGGVVYVGYLVGGWLTAMGVDIDTVLLPIIAVILILSVLPGVYNILRDKKQRQAIFNSFKIGFKRLFRIKTK